MDLRGAHRPCADGVEQDCTDTSKACNSLGSASVMWERLTFITALPTRLGTQEIFDHATQTYQNVSGFHQGPCLATTGGNRQGTYLTMMSSSGLSFGVINTVGNFGTVFCDQSYWQSAIAAKPASAHKGYILGGMVWFTIPFALATSLGLAGNALNVALTVDDAGSGLVPPASAIAMMGTVGGTHIRKVPTHALTKRDACSSAMRCPYNGRLILGVLC